MALLEIRNLKVNYGPIQAVRGIDITVEEGGIVALLGANGAGKTTTLRTVSGVIKPSGGSIQLAGQEISQLRACKVARMGINMSPEGRLVFAGLTVEENLRAGAYCIRSRAETEKNMKRVLTLFPRLEERLRQQAGTLSGGEQQMLAIARALMASPKLLMLDEPSLGLAPLVIKDIFRTLQEMRSEGTTILIGGKTALATLKIADYAYVLELGKISMQGPAEELIHDEKLIEAYLGNKKT